MNRRSFIAAVASGIAALGFKSVAKGSPAPPVKTTLPIEDYDNLLWGTYGPYGHGPMKIVPIGECETSHLQNILLTEQWHLNDLYTRGIEAVLRRRGVEPVEFSFRRSSFDLPYRRARLGV